MKPYTDIEVTDSYIIREFSENIDPIELLWHRDDEDRTLEILKQEKHLLLDIDVKQLMIEPQLDTGLADYPDMLNY